MRTIIATIAVLLASPPTPLTAYAVDVMIAKRLRV
jgi:hypothetical protein